MKRKLPPPLPTSPSSSKGGGGARIGRPTIYDPVIADRICELLAEKNSLREVCALKDMPALRTVWYWLSQGERPDAQPELKDFLHQYARARSAQAEAFAEEIVEIADEAPETAAGASKAKNRIEARKWVAAKLLPKKYGDRIEHAGSGPNGEHVVNHNVAMGTLPAAEGYRQMLDGPPKK